MKQKSGKKQAAFRHSAQKAAPLPRFEEKMLFAGSAGGQFRTNVNDNHHTVALPGIHL